ncbi:MAG: aldehyde dehydrogenase [Parvibaculaceae bacterium]
MNERLDFAPDDIVIPSGHFIDGQVQSTDDDMIEVVRPSDGRFLGRIPDGSQETVERAVASAWNAFKTSGWPVRAPRERGKVLRRWARLIEENVTELARLEAVGSTRPIAEATAGDIPTTADLIRYYGEYADKLEGTVTSTSADVTSLLVKEPYGVVAAIVAWNTPLVNAAVKIGAALAAGNALIVKPSELTPFSLLKLCQLATEAGVPPGLLGVVNGRGDTAGARLVRHPDVRKVSFTGSTATGARIMQDAAATGPKPVTLELGGKSPMIVFEDAPDIDRIVTMLARGVVHNAGQVCTCGSRLLVERSARDQVVSKLISAMSALTPGATWLGGTTLGPIINHRQLQRIETLISQSLGGGGRVIAGGTRIENEGGAFFLPTVLEAVDEGNAGFLNEFFGPITAVQTFSDVDEAVALAAHPTYGLAASVFTGNLKTAMHIARRIEAGSIRVNQHSRAPEFTAAAGGFKGSGFGKDWGRPGIEGYLREKTIWINHG